MADIHERLRDIERRLAHAEQDIQHLHKEDQILAAIDDLNNAVTSLQDAETIEEAQLTEIINQLRNNATDPAAVQAAATALTAIRDKISAFPGSVGGGGAQPTP